MICEKCNVEMLEITESDVEKERCYLCGFELNRILTIKNREIKLTVAIDRESESLEDNQEEILFTLGDYVYRVECKLSEITLNHYHHAFCEILLPNDIKFVLDEEPVRKIAEFLALPVHSESVFED